MALLRKLDRHIDSLQRTRNMLRSNLAVLNNYDKARGDVAEPRKQLGALNQALRSLQKLSDQAKQDTAGVTAALSGQVDKSLKRSRSLEVAVGTSRGAADQAAGQPIPELPTDPSEPVSRALAMADATNRPPGSPPGGKGPVRQSASSDRAAAGPSDDGRSTQSREDHAALRPAREGVEAAPPKPEAPAPPAVRWGSERPSQPTTITANYYGTTI